MEIEFREIKAITDLLYIELGQCMKRANYNTYRGNRNRYR